MMTEPLTVRLSGTEIGFIHSNGAFTWVPNWQELSPLNAPALSHSLRFGAPDPDPRPFFGGLLPEGVGLERLSREIGASTTDLYALLAAVGADVGGSVTIGEPRPPLEPLPVSEPDLIHELHRAAGYLRGSTVGGGGSAATGVQQKIALTLDDNGEEWLNGRGSTPSTHLLKPITPEFGARLHAESFLNSVARELGLSAHSTDVRRIGDLDVLIVERYDRVHSNGQWQRIHQEDAAQALGLPWGGNDKYESVNDRAALKSVAQLLRTSGSALSASPNDREKLLALTTLNVAAGNTDAHAKNFSLLLPPLSNSPRTQRARLADAYDLVPQSFFATEADPLAMRINGLSSLRRVTADDLVAEGMNWRLSESACRRTVDSTLRNIADSLDSTASTHDAPPALVEFLAEQTTNLLGGNPAWTRRLSPGIAYRQASGE